MCCCWGVYYTSMGGVAPCPPRDAPTPLQCTLRHAPHGRHITHRCSHASHRGHTGQAVTGMDMGNCNPIHLVIGGACAECVCVQCVYVCIKAVYVGQQQQQKGISIPRCTCATIQSSSPYPTHLATGGRVAPNHNMLLLLHAHHHTRPLHHVL